MTPLSPLSFGVFPFEIQCLTPMHLRPFVTSTLRGAWGTPFQRMAHLTRKQKHEGCVLRTQYPYGVFFEPAPQSERLAHYSAIPRRYVLNASALLQYNLQPTDTFSFDVTPIRRAVRHLPYFIYLSRSLEDADLGRQQQDGYGRSKLATAKGASIVIYNRNSAT